MDENDAVTIGDHTGAATIVWAAVGFLDLGKIATIVLTAIVAAPAVYGSVMVANSAFQAETDPANN